MRGGEALKPGKEHNRIAWCVMVRRRQRKYIAYPLRSLEVDTPENGRSHSTLSYICKKARQDLRLVHAMS